MLIPVTRSKIRRAAADRKGKHGRLTLISNYEYTALGFEYDVEQKRMKRKQFQVTSSQFKSAQVKEQ